MGDRRAATRTGSTVNTVVIGVDGSAESLSALRWADRITAPGGAMHVIAAISPAEELAIAAVQVDSTKHVERVAEHLETDWTREIRADARCRVVEDDPADAILRAAADADADLIVVGVHPKPAHGPRTIGRVTARLIHHADRPVAIVEDGGELPIGEGTTVVADAGHGTSAETAVRWAAGFADAHDTSLSMVRSTPNHPFLGPDGLLDVLAFYVDRELLHQWAAEDLTRLAEEIQQSTERELRISWTERAGAAGAQLVEAGTNATLIVVERGDGGAMIPNTVRHVITHAPCPVIVVPRPAD